MNVNVVGRMKLSGQLLVVIAVIFGFQSIAHAKRMSTPKFTPTYKVERCDCLGYSDDIPTFLTDLAGADSVDELYIYGEGKSIAAAEESAQNLCIETYRSYASVEKKEDASTVTQSGCTKLKSTPDGRWVSL